MQVDRITLFDGTELLVHPADMCRGDICPFHKPTDHEFRDCGFDWNGNNVLRMTKDGPVIDPDDYLFRTMGEAIIRNSATCAVCGEELVSLHRHHFVSCKCGNFIDGGTDYLRSGGEGLIDTSIVVRR